MKKIIMVLIICIITLSGCGEIKKSDKINIVTTISPLNKLVNVIGGDKVNVSSIYPIGADLHSYEPTTQDMKKITDSDMVFYVSDLEEPFIKKLAQNDENTNYIDMSQQVTLKKAIGTKLYDKAGSLIDPHFWLSPKKGLIINEIICSILIENDTDNQEYYKDNAKKSYTQLLKVDQDYKQLAKQEIKPIIISHEAFDYLVRDYSFDIIALSGIEEDDKPTSKKIQKIIDLIKKEQIKNIYVTQNDLNNPFIKQISQETKTNILV